MDLTGPDSLVVIVVGWWAMGIPTGREKGPVELARFDRATLGVFPVQVFAYTCAQNVSPLPTFWKGHVRSYIAPAVPRFQRVGEEYPAQNEQGDRDVHRVGYFDYAP
jgi:hypothetical protein